MGPQFTKEIEIRYFLVKDTLGARGFFFFVAKLRI